MKIELFFGQYRFLSNFFPCIVRMEGIDYPTLEHAYQAAKTLDEEERRKIALAAAPKEAKRLGSSLALRPDWDDIRLCIMEELLCRKFAPGSDLAGGLIATHPAELIEGNFWNDTYWGVCRGRGENHLGRLLMKIRASLMA